MNEATRDEATNQELVLVVDDDELLREALITALLARGLRVVERNCGESALRYLREGELPDLILLDLVMPNMDGWEFRAAQLQDGALAGIPVVALSGDLSAKARALHAQAYLPKPLCAAQLLQTVDTVLAQTRAEHDTSERLAQFAELVEEAVRPVRLASDVMLSNLDAALALLLRSDAADDERTLTRLLFWLSGARIAAKCVSDDIARAELFAHRHAGRARDDRARVLVVDDDEARRELVVEGLRAFYVVGSAASAPEALLTLRALGDYDAVVCRLCMHGGSGADLLYSLSASHPGQAARFLFLSADSRQELLEEPRIARLRHLGLLHGAPDIEAIRSLIMPGNDTRH